MKLEYLNRCNLCMSRDIAAVDRDHNIFKCNNCGYVFDNPRPTFQEIADFYSREGKYDSWIEERKGRDLLWQRRLAMVKRYKKAGSLLDIGTGIGEFLYFAGDNFEVEGTEISESAAETAKERYGLDLIRGEIENIDFGDRRFDVITLFHVLEHLPDPSSVLKRCRDLLSEEGVLIIAVPNEIDSFIKRPVKRLSSILGIGRFKKCGKFGLPELVLDGSLSEIHLSHFTVPTLKKWLNENNFVILEDTLDPYYSATGGRKKVHDLLFLVFSAIKTALRVNLYDAIWIAAKCR